MIFHIMLIVVFTSYTCYANDTQKGLLRHLSDCAADDGWNGVVECGTNRMVKVLNKASLKQDVEIFSGVHLISDEPASERIAKSMKDQKLTLNSTSKQETDSLFHSIGRFLSGRSLKVRIPEILTESSARAAMQSKPKKNSLGPLLLGLGATLLTMVPVMMGGLALLSSKAVLISKIAMVVSMILFIQYFFNQGKSIFPSNTGMIGVAPYAYGPSYPYPYFGVAAHTQEKPSYRRNLRRRSVLL